MEGEEKVTKGGFTEEGDMNNVYKGDRGRMDGVWMKVGWWIKDGWWMKDRWMEGVWMKGGWRVYG